MIIKPVVTALNAVTYTAITIPRTNRPVPVSYYTEDETGFYVAIDASGTGEALVPEKTGVNIEQMSIDADGLLLYAKAVSGTPNLVVMIGVP